MEIGQIEMRSDEITVTVRAFSTILGERVTDRLNNGWLSIPIRSIIELSIRYIQKGPMWTINDLRIVSNLHSR